MSKGEEMTKQQEFIKKHKKAVYTVSFLFAVFMGCFTFPVINFNYRTEWIISFINIIVTIGAYSSIGQLEAVIYPDVFVGRIMLLNTGLVVLGMISRYFLEYGEVSNTYNFTLLNSCVHIFLTVLWSTVNWYKYRKQFQGDR